MIYTITLNPALDKTVTISGFCPNTINRITGVRTDPGGKGINVSKVIHALGRNSVAFALLAGNTGRAIQDAVNQLGIACEFFFTEGETRTNLKVVDPVNHTNTDINEPGFVVTPEILDTILDRLTEMLHPDDIVFFSGTLPPGAPENTYSTWIRRCKECGAKTFFDADGALLVDGISAVPYLIKPNNNELSGFVGRRLTSHEEFISAADALIDRGIDKAVVSLGADGILYISKNEVIYSEGISVPVGSTVGAGDSLAAAFAVAEEEHMSTEDAVTLASAVGAANVMCSGTQAADYETVKSLLGRVRLHKLR